MTRIETNSLPALDAKEEMSRNPGKRYLVTAFLFFALCSLIIIWINWRVDPLQFYRKASYPPDLHSFKRFQSPGMAKHYDYDGIVIGTSLSQNFRADDLKEALGFDSMNFAVQGASAYEQAQILQVALRTRKVKTVVWDIQFEYLRGDSSWISNAGGSYPKYLYDENPWNEVYAYLLNAETCKSSFKILLGRLGIKTYREQNVEEFYMWDRKAKFGIATVKGAWERAMKLRAALQRQTPEFALTNLNTSFDLNYLKAIKENPDVTFYLFFPPYTPGYYRNLEAASPEIFQNMLANREYIFRQTRGLTNVRLYDFQTAPDSILNMENYCDAMHFNHNVAEYIIHSLASGDHLVNRLDNADLKAWLTNSASTAWMEKLLN